ncbi:L10-interacting MYB domain-containing protein isoform X1 [Helianthus annuus]|uniref:L10-interacting MYB domain-containing protein isoform X1 n=1 Tax=Helianthus annuus TaxID=4232 RepID=UPI001652CC5F|nr:L10-interacting MYB domain-containing protein isoform X1 [Helianthus annuus]
MDLNHDNDVVVMKTKKKKIRSLWTDDTHMIFLELCLNEVRVGNKPTGYFNKFGYENLEKYMKERTGKTFDHKQIKNHWETMKKEWKLYDRLMRLESGIGWDPVRKTIDASDEWWDEKIKGDKDLSKLRGQNLEMYKIYYEPLFRDCVAVGDNTKTPSDFANMIDKDEELIEGRGDSDEINVSSDDQEPIFSKNSLTKRKKSKNVSSSRSTKRKTSITSAFEDKLDNVMQALSSRSSQSFPPQNSSPSIKDCMDIVLTFPGFEEGSRNYCHALDIFLKKQARENFMVPTSDVAKMEFLKYLMEK